MERIPIVIKKKSTITNEKSEITNEKSEITNENLEKSKRGRKKKEDKLTYKEWYKEKGFLYRQYRYIMKTHSDLFNIDELQELYPDKTDLCKFVINEYNRIKLQKNKYIGQNCKILLLYGYIIII